MRRALVYIFLLVAIFLIGFSGVAWWWLAVPAALTGLVQRSYKRAFTDAFLSAFVIWAAVALSQDAQTGFRISQRVAGVFHLPLNALALVMTGLVAGLLAGTAGMSGQSIRQIIPGRYIPRGK